MTMQLLAAHARVYWGRQGWTSRVGLVMLVLAVVVYLFMLRPGQEEVQALRAKNQAMASNATRAPVAKAGQGASLDSLMAELPADSAMLEQVGNLVELAGTARVTLDKGEYKVLRDGKDGLQRQQMSFPLKVRYPDLREFLGRALPAMPGLALTSLTLQRENIQSETVDGRIIFTLYAKGQ